MLSLLSSKLGAYALGALALFGAGCFAGYRMELPAVQAAKLQLAAQVTEDAQVTAAADAKAASYEAELMAAGNAAEDDRNTGRQARAGAAKVMLGQIATLAAQSGQDAPLSPVLAAAITRLAAQQKAAAP